MITLPLTKGFSAIIDDADEALANHKWCVHVTACGHKYAIRAVRKPDGRYTTVYLHREILGLTERSRKADHINGDTLDNRRQNLRDVDNATNIRNIVGARKHSATGILGVFKRKDVKSTPYHAFIKLDGKLHLLGGFATLEEAAAARLKAEREIWGIVPRRAAAHAATTSAP